MKRLICLLLAMMLIPLYGLAEAIGSVLKIPCRVAADARDCVVLGCAKVLADPSGMRHLLESA